MPTKRRTHKQKLRAAGYKRRKMKTNAAVIIQTAFRVFQCAIVNTVLADATAATNNNGKETKD